MEWKAHYLGAHEGCELHTQVSGGKEPCNDANAATKGQALAETAHANATSAIVNRLDNYINHIARKGTFSGSLTQ